MLLYIIGLFLSHWGFAELQEDFSCTIQQTRAHKHCGIIVVSSHIALHGFETRQELRIDSQGHCVDAPSTHKIKTMISEDCWDV